jgi:DNA gyrase subunit A
MDEDEVNLEIRGRLERLEILEALVVGLERHSELFEIVWNSPDADAARFRIADTFGLSLVQATAIQDVQVRRFAAKERDRVIRERDGLREELS